MKSKEELKKDLHALIDSIQSSRLCFAHHNVLVTSTNLLVFRKTKLMNIYTLHHVEQFHGCPTGIVMNIIQLLNKYFFSPYA